MNSTTKAEPISPEERRRRQAAVDFARANIGLEGFTVSPETEALTQRFINGEIELEEFIVHKKVAS